MKTTLAILLTCATAGTAIAAPPVPRHQADSFGSAIALEFSAQHDVMRPGEGVTLLLCLTNQNPASRRDVQPGDQFAFEFAGGALGDCGSLSVVSPSGELQPADFACDVVGQSVRLTRMRSAAPWPPLDSLCVRVPYVAPSATTEVATSMDVGNSGAFRASSPAAIVLSIGDDLGSVGPQGETGPAGPSGPPGAEGVAGAPGPSGVGAVVFAVSTGTTSAEQGEPVPIIPGLDVEVLVAAGSRIEVLADLRAFPCFQGGRSPSPFKILLRVDGMVVAQRGSSYDGLSSFASTLSPAWVSPVLVAGPHRVQVLVDFLEPPRGTSDVTNCIGSAANDVNQARLIVKELRSAP